MWQRLEQTSTQKTHTGHISISTQSQSVYKLIFFFFFWKKNATSCYTFLSFKCCFFSTLAHILCVDIFSPPVYCYLFNGAAMQHMYIQWNFQIQNDSLMYLSWSFATTAATAVLCWCYYCLEKFAWFWPFSLLISLFLYSSHVYYHWSQWVEPVMLVADIAPMVMDSLATEKNSKNRTKFMFKRIIQFHWFFTPRVINFKTASD